MVITKIILLKKPNIEYFFVLAPYWKELLKKVGTPNISGKSTLFKDSEESPANIDGLTCIFPYGCFRLAPLFESKLRLMQKHCNWFYFCQKFKKKRNIYPFNFTFSISNIGTFLMNKVIIQCSWLKMRFHSGYFLASSVLVGYISGSEFNRI